MADKPTRVRVKFLDSIAGLRDPIQAALETKYKKLEESMSAEKNGKVQAHSKVQIAAAVDAARRSDEAVIRTGFVKDWSYKPGEEALVSVAIAKAWEEAGIVSIITQQAAA